MTPQKKQRLKELLDRLNTLDQKSGGVLSSAQVGMSSMLRGVVKGESESFKNEFKERPVLKALDKMSADFEQLRKDIDIKSITQAIQDADTENTERMSDVVRAFESRIEGVLGEVSQSEQRGTQITSQEIGRIAEQIAAFQEEFNVERTQGTSTRDLLTAEVSRLSQELGIINKKIGTSKKEEGVHKTLVQNIEETKRAKRTADEALESIESLRNNVNARIASLQQRGGGNANRNIAIGGNGSVLNMFTDINFKAGNNVTITYQNNTATKYLDVTISATGGGGGGSVTGITRSVNTVAVNTLAGSNTGVDYVYLASGNVTVTLPTTVGNSNLYTVKNIGAGTVIVNTTGGETIDGGTNVTMPVQFTSVDLISNNSGNWDVT